MTGRYTIRRDGQILVQVVDRTLAYRLWDVYLSQTARLPAHPHQTIAVELVHPMGRVHRTAYFPPSGPP